MDIVTELGKLPPWATILGLIAFVIACITSIGRNVLSWGVQKHIRIQVGRIAKEMASDSGHTVKDQVQLGKEQNDTIICMINKIGKRLEDAEDDRLQMANELHAVKLRVDKIEHWEARRIFHDAKQDLQTSALAAEVAEALHQSPPTPESKAALEEKRLGERSNYQRTGEGGLS